MIENKKWVKFTGVLFMALLSMNCNSMGPIKKSNSKHDIHVAADSRIELMSVIFMLAGNDEYRIGKIPSYNRDVETYFKKYKNHPVVEYAGQLRRTQGVGYNAPMDMAIHITDVVQCREKVPFDIYIEQFDDRWTLSNAREFLKQAKAFVKESKFKSFFDNNRKLYQLTAERIRQVIDEHAHIEWFDHYFGERPSARFYIVPGMLTGGCNYGVSMKNLDDVEEIYCIRGVIRIDDEGLPVFSKSMIPTIIHEFCHSYTNSLVKANLAELGEAGKIIYPHVAQVMRQQAYGTWKTIMNESMVRACVVRYISEYDGEEAAKKRALEEQLRKFIWVGDLAELLKDYESQRDKYPTLNSFFPEIVRFFNDYAANIDKNFAEFQNAWAAKAPKIISIDPPNGAKDVNPNIKNITITFDRKMKDKNWAVIPLGETERHLSFNGEIFFDNEHRFLTVPVELKPGCKYELSLNMNLRLSFRSEEGIPLVPAKYQFETRID